MASVQGIYRVTRLEDGEWCEVVRLKEVVDPSEITIRGIGLHLDTQNIDPNTGQGDTHVCRLERLISFEPEEWLQLVELPPFTVRMPFRESGEVVQAELFELFS